MEGEATCLSNIGEYADWACGHRWKCRSMVRDADIPAQDKTPEVYSGNPSDSTIADFISNIPYSFFFVERYFAK